MEQFGKPKRPQRPDILFFQEHRKASIEACKSAEDWAQQRGCTITLAPAKITGSGNIATSGGVGIGARDGIGIRATTCKAFRKFPGRMHAANINAICPLAFAQWPFTSGMALTFNYWRPSPPSFAVALNHGWSQVIGKPPHSS